MFEFAPFLDEYCSSSSLNLNILSNVDVRVKLPNRGKGVGRGSTRVQLRSSPPPPIAAAASRDRQGLASGVGVAGEGVFSSWRTSQIELSVRQTSNPVERRKGRLEGGANASARCPPGRLGGRAARWVRIRKGCCNRRPSRTLLKITMSCPLTRMGCTKRGVTAPRTCNRCPWRVSSASTCTLLATGSSMRPSASWQAPHPLPSYLALPRVR